MWAFFGREMGGDVGIGGVTDREPNHLSGPGVKTFTQFFPSGTSFQSLNHVRQLMCTEEFAEYDQGEE